MAPVKLSLFLALSACMLHAADEPGRTTANDQPKETLAAMAGVYYHGDGLGMTMRLAIAPDGLEVQPNTSFVKVTIPRGDSLQRGQHVHSRPDRRE